MLTELPGIGPLSGGDAQGYRTPPRHVEIIGAACEITVDWIEPGQEAADLAEADCRSVWGSDQEIPEGAVYWSPR